MKNSFKGWVLGDVLPIGLFIPPSYLEPFFKNRIRFLDRLANMERSTARFKFLAGAGVRCCAVGLLPPGKTSTSEQEILPFYLVQAKEIPKDLPLGEEAVHWRIITNIPTYTFDQAKQIVHYYTRRWMVEQLFRTTKSEGFRLEDTELESLDAIFKQAIMAFQTACKVLQLVYARNRYDSQPIQQVFPHEQIQVLEQLNQQYEGKTLAQKNPYPKDQLSWAAWVIARLGGWKGYASKRPPGPMTMLWGLEKFAVFLQAWTWSQKNEQPTAEHPP